MAVERIIQAIVDKCDFYYGDALTSKEELLRRYLDFFARQFDPKERSVCFTFHTGSRCFDVVSIAALTIGCLAYEYSKNDEILSQLKIGDPVLFKGQRYRWGGVEERCSNGDETRREWVVLCQETKEGHPRKCSYPYETNKHKIKPYYGSSSRTDGRGIRKDMSNREDFISYVLDIPLNETPTSLDYSFVVVANKADFEEICDNLIIKYKDGKSVKVTDVIPVSYYSALDKPIQIGSNVAKAEPVIKVTNNVSVARDIILDKSQNRVLGLLVTNIDSLTSETSELDDLLQRERLKFAHVIAPFNFDSCQRAIDQYESAKVFACTNELLDATSHEMVSDNELSRKLHRQASNVRVRKIEKIEVGGEWRWEIVKHVKSLLMKVKESNYVGDDIDSIVLSTMALINLFSSAFFCMKQLENAVSEGTINPAVISPKKRLDDLEKDLKSSLLTNQYVEIVAILQKAYKSLFERSPKEQALLQFLREHQDERIAVVVPKAYYVEIFNVAYRKEFKNVICVVTANAFDQSEQYDIVVETGDFIGRNFDAFQCFTTPRIVLFLYDFESRKFAYRKRETTRINRNINARNCGLTEDERARAIAMVDDCVPEITEQPDREFSVLDDYLKDERAFRKALINKTYDKDSNKTAEVEYVGRFTTDEGILFSKYYSAVVYDEDSEEVIEKKPEKLKPGDKLVFTKSDSVNNIIDQIFDQLERKNKLPPRLLDSKRKSIHWKDVLSKHKDFYNRSYRDLAASFGKHGCSLSETAIREWLIEECVTIGPRKKGALEAIAQITHDPSLLNNLDGYYDAFEDVRSFRGDLRRMIAQAIREKLSRKRTQHDDVFDVVYENVEEYSEILILEDKDKLDKAEACNVRSVNKPIFIGDLL